MKHMNYELSTKEFHLGHGPVGEREGWQTQLEMLHWTHAFQIVCGRTPAAIQTTPGQLGKAETGTSAGSPAGPWCPEGPAAYSASGRCQMHAPPVSSGEHLPEGGVGKRIRDLERGSRKAIKRNHQAEKAKRHLDTVLASRMANGFCLMGWISQWWLPGC